MTDITKDQAINKAARTIRALKHRLRLVIMETITKNSNRMSVTEIYTRLRLEQSVASQHLAILRKADMVKTSRDGKHIYYSVNHNRIDEVKSICEKF